MIITLTGPAASGKGTLGRLLSSKYNIPYYDVGLLFRLYSYLIDKEWELEEIESSIANDDIRILAKEDQVIFNGENITPILRTEEVGYLTAQNCSNSDLLNKLFKITEDILSGYTDVICDGRNCGLEIFPNAEYKFYITANPEARTGRRSDQLKETELDSSQSEKLLNKRDTLDKNRVVGSLRIPENSAIVDTTDKSIEESLSEIVKHISSLNFEKKA